jgi:hypothetical protein
MNDLNRPASAPGRAGRRTLGIVGGLLLLQAVLVAAFVLPAHKPEPHDVPVGVVGMPRAQEALDEAMPGAFDVTRYASAVEAREAIEERDVYGAVVAEGDELRLFVASAASAPIAQLLQTAFAGHGAEVAVTDVKPLAEEDPRGATLNLLFLPLIVVCFPAVLLLGKLHLRAPALLGALALFATLGGLAVVAFVAGALDALPGSYLALSGVAALTILAIALPTAGLYRLLGHAGVGLAALLFVLIGNPASGNGTAPEVLPGFWRAISQLMPPGAGGTGLRNTAYFDGNATLQPLLVLTTYAVVGGLLVLAAGAVRRRRRDAGEVVELTPTPIERAA